MLLYLRLQPPHHVDVFGGQLERASLQCKVPPGRHPQDEAEVDVDQSTLRVE